MSKFALWNCNEITLKLGEFIFFLAKYDTEILPLTEIELSLEQNFRIRISKSCVGMVKVVTEEYEI